MQFMPDAAREFFSQVTVEASWHPEIGYHMGLQSIGGHGKCVGTGITRQEKMIMKERKKCFPVPWGKDLMTPMDAVSCGCVSVMANLELHRERPPCVCSWSHTDFCSSTS